MLPSCIEIRSNPIFNYSRNNKSTAINYHIAAILFPLSLRGEFFFPSTPTNKKGKILAKPPPNLTHHTSNQQVLATVMYQPTTQTCSHEHGAVPPDSDADYELISPHSRRLITGVLSNPSLESFRRNGNFPPQAFVTALSVLSLPL